MSGYPSRQEFFAFGLPSKAFAASPQIVESVDSGADVLVIRSHGFTDGDRVRAVAMPGGGGIPDGALPAGLSPSILYYVVGVAALGVDMLQVSTTLGGSAVDMTNAGTAPFGLVPDVGSKIDLGLEAVSRHADQFLKGHATPLVTAPAQLKRWICHILAADMAVSSGLVDPTYAKDPEVAARGREAQRQLDRMQRDGEELAGLVVDATPAVSDNASVGWGDPDRCWTPGGVI